MRFVATRGGMSVGQGGPSPDRVAVEKGLPLEGKPTAYTVMGLVLGITCARIGLKVLWRLASFVPVWQRLHGLRTFIDRRLGLNPQRRPAC
jgi:hypothetical protein